MAETATGEEQKLPSWFSGMCDRLWKMQRAFWTLFGLGALASLLAFLLALQWPFASNKSLNGTFLGWCFNHAPLLLFIGLFYLALFGIVYVGHHYYRLARTIASAAPVPITPIPVPAKTPEQVREEQLQGQQKEAERRYLQRMIRDNENLIPKGVPGLVASVPLDEVFIPLQFKPGKPPSDKPISEQERHWHRDFLQHFGHLYPQEATAELERALFLSEQEYESILERRVRVDFAYLWQNCTRKEPAAVIQGYPGMGKSTLTQRLGLYMARRSLSLPDPGMAQADDIQPTLIPVLIPLKEFADAREQNANLSLEAFLTHHLDKLCIPGSDSFVLTALKSGRCLVMLDGLDEVSNPHTRKQVQEDIRTFVAANADVSAVDFNRFLITSRVAGYDLAAFPDYLHYLIAELSPEQIKNFLPRWCRASVRNLLAPGANLAALPEQNEAVTRGANLLASKLSEAIAHNQGVRDMAETPLLLTLLAVMQQIRGVLPDRRIELYKAVTKTLLEDRNEARKLDPIPENQAIQYLSPLAFTMQDTGNSFARERDVLASLQALIQKANTSLNDQAALQEARDFLQRVGERSGLFVQRTGDYFGFMHRTFQEYFAAHFLLNAIQADQQRGIEDLVSRARRPGDSWREPFLFAVAYQSDSYGKIADQIIRSLLDTPQSASQEQREHDLLLAAECVIEAKPLSIEPALELDIATRLLQTYEQAQSEQRYQSCGQIENMVRRRLLSLPKNSNRLSLLTVLREAISDSDNIPLQRATLTMLAMIAQQLTDCPPNVFAALVPPLLALAGLPAVGNYQPAQGITVSADLDVADLALTVLSFLGKPGPSGLLLAEVRQYFKDNPDHLRLLARYSLESGALITPCVVPLTDENYQRYEAAIDQWLKLDDAQKTARLSEQAIDSCLRIQQSLLDCAEEVTYPTATLLLSLLTQSAAHPEQSWQEAWKNSLERELSTKSYINYQQAAQLWTTLFIDDKNQQMIAHILIDNYINNRSLLYRYALRFFTNITEDLRNLRDFRDFRYLRNLRNLRDLRDLRNLGNLGNLRYLRYLRYLIFTQDVTAEAMNRLTAITNQSEQVDLLSILLGRILQIAEANEKGESVEREVRQVVQYVYPTFTASSDPLVSDAALDILRYLPVRSANESRYVLSLVEQASEQQIWQACALALQYADPETEEAWRALEAGKRSSKKAVREAVEERIRQR